MPKITYVKKAQQRYATVPVLDENGEQKKVPVTVKNGEQKVTKHGRPVFRSVTVADYNKPLPNHTCGKCGNEIKVGDPYMWIAPKSGPYGGTKMLVITIGRLRRTTLRHLNRSDVTRLIEVRAENVAKASAAYESMRLACASLDRLLSRHGTVSDALAAGALSLVDDTPAAGEESA